MHGCYRLASNLDRPGRAPEGPRMGPGWGLDGPQMGPSTPNLDRPGSHPEPIWPSGAHPGTFQGPSGAKLDGPHCRCLWPEVTHAYAAALGWKFRQEGPDLRGPANRTAPHSEDSAIGRLLPMESPRTRSKPSKPAPIGPLANRSVGETPKNRKT